MAISFKSDKDYGYSLLPLFGVSQQIIQAAKDAGVQVDQSSPGTFVVKQGDSTYGSVTVKGSAISLAKSKTLGPASKEALKFQFEAALKKALPMSGTSAAPFQDVKPAPWTGVMKKTTAGPSAINPGILKPVVPMSFPKVKFPKQDAVPLLEATEVYQPVTGTTHGSVYYVLALFDGLKLAARVAGMKLSIRAEGSDLKNFKAALEDMGMDYKASYSSGHFDVSNTGLMIKALGAVVGRVGFGKVTQMADIETFIAGQV